jgi:extracellular factor (EF) 3-hydroxypalmitic acid methyl ester biosynthesis protein
MKGKDSMLFCSSHTGFSTPDAETPVQLLYKATDRFNQQMQDIERRCSDPQEAPEALLQAVALAFDEVGSHFAVVEQALQNDAQKIKAQQVEFRSRTHEYFSKSRLMHHARTWPHGYEGDYEMLEAIYRNEPMSTGLGYYLDRHFLSNVLAEAVRNRKEFMRSLLAEELLKRKGPKILNLASGSGRELGELAGEIKASGATVTCVDFDADALQFSQKLFAAAGLLPGHASFRKYNVQKMVNRDRNRKEFGPQDVVYSIGLFDYLGDGMLVRLLGALYDLLAPDGKLIASFKDCTRYNHRYYQWMSDWSTFFQRTEEQCRALFDRAGIPAGSLALHRDGSGPIIFFIVSR